MIEMKEMMEQKEVTINVSYPQDPNFDIFTELETIDLDKERESDILNNRGFVISSPKGIVKDIKDPDGIFSLKYGQTLSDTNPFIDRYKCTCGALKSRSLHGIVCKTCRTPVKYVDDDFEYFGWIVLNKHYIIHPNLYSTIAFFIGSNRFKNILNIEDNKDQDGHSTTENQTIKKDEPFFGIGMVQFMKRFQEIMDYYLTKNPNKKDYYDNIMNHKDIVFTQSIPVFTTQLRPFDIENKSFTYEGINGMYTMMSKLAASINNDSLRLFRKKKEINELLYDLQENFNELTTEIDKNLSGKKGNFRQLLGGRYNFSARMVIAPNPTLRSDQITLPYKALVELLQQSIINVLQKTYNMSYNDAWTLWYKAKIKKDDLVAKIIQGLMFANPRGLAFMVNRNPTIIRGGILQLFCVGMTDTYTMGISLQVLSLFNADFDGDALNMFLIINELFYERAFQVFNPRNAMCISNNDGKLNVAVMPQRDRLINANTVLRLGRKYYSEEQISKLRETVSANDY